MAVVTTDLFARFRKNTFLKHITEQENRHEQERTYFQSVVGYRNDSAQPIEARCHEGSVQARHPIERIQNNLHRYIITTSFFLAYQLFQVIS